MFEIKDTSKELANVGRPDKKCIWLTFSPGIKIFKVWSRDEEGDIYIPFTEKELAEYVKYHPILMNQIELAKQYPEEKIIFGD